MNVQDALLDYVMEWIYLGGDDHPSVVEKKAIAMKAMADEIFRPNRLLTALRSKIDEHEANQKRWRP